MKITSILLISFLLISSCKQVKKRDSTTLMNPSHESIDKINKKEPTQIESKCFTKSDIEKVDSFFKSIVKNDTNFKSTFVFKEKDLKKLKELFIKKSFDSFELKHDDVECDSYLLLDILERQRYDDGDEIHYSETNRMYKLMRKGKYIIVESAGIAG